MKAVISFFFRLFGRRRKAKKKDASIYPMF